MTEVKFWRSGKVSSNPAILTKKLLDHFINTQISEICVALRSEDYFIMHWQIFLLQASHKNTD